MRRCLLLALVSAGFLAPTVALAQPSTKTDELTRYYLRTGHFQSAFFYAQEKKPGDKPKKSAEPRTGSIREVIVIGETASANDVRREMKTFLGQYFDEKLLRDFEKKLKPFNATIEVIDTKDAHFKDILITLNKKEDGKKEPGDVGNLEQQIAEAMKNNPDIRVAEAKVREAEAHLSRARMKAISDVSFHHARVQAAQANFTAAQARYDRAKILSEKGAISIEDLGITKLSRLKWENEVIIAKLMLGMVLGKPLTETAKPPATQEQMIQDAVKNNPDLRVAEATLRETDAELNRTRMKVVSDLSRLHADIRAAQMAWDEGRTRYERAKTLRTQGVVSADDLGAAKLAMQNLAADVDVIRIKLPYLLGKQPVGFTSSTLIDELIRKKWNEEAKDTTTTDEEYLRRMTLDLQGRMPTPLEMQQYMKLPQKERRTAWLDRMEKNPPMRVRDWDEKEMRQHWLAMWSEVAKPTLVKQDSPQQEKLRKLLDTPMKFAFRETSLPDFLMYLRDKGLDTNTIIRTKSKNQKITGQFDTPISLGAMFQYIEDELDVVFILRDYGIVVLGAMDRRPPDAVRLVDFWKHAAPPTKTPAK